MPRWRIRCDFDAAPRGFRAAGVLLPSLRILKFLIDRTGYIKQLEEEDTPDSLARIDNLRELVNAAMDSRDRGETLANSWTTPRWSATWTLTIRRQSR